MNTGQHHPFCSNTLQKLKEPEELT